MEVLPDISSQEESVLKPWIDPHQLKQHQGIWYKDGQQVVTGDTKDKRHIIQSHHDTPVHGHPGISKTIQLTERLYWWPKMRLDITEYVKGCAECVTVSPSPQSKDEENEKLHKLRKYARDFRRQHTTDAEQFDWDSDDGDYGLAIGRLVVT
jgi:hypothetical protein